MAAGCLGTQGLFQHVLPEPLPSLAVPAALLSPLAAARADVTDNTGRLEPAWRSRQLSHSFEWRRRLRRFFRGADALWLRLETARGRSSLRPSPTVHCRETVTDPLRLQTERAGDSAGGAAARRSTSEARRAGEGEEERRGKKGPGRRDAAGAPATTSRAPRNTRRRAHDSRWWRCRRA